MLLFLVYNDKKNEISDFFSTREGEGVSKLDENDMIMSL